MKKALYDVKSFVTILMTIALVVILFIPYEIDKDILVIFSTAYGSITTYFFTKKNKDLISSNDTNKEIEKEI